MSAQITVAVMDGEQIIQKVALNAVEQGGPVIVQAVPDGVYVFEDEEGKGPERLSVRRVGDDLHVVVEGAGSSQPVLVIEGYFGAGGQGQLVGMGADSSYQTYLTTDGGEFGVLQDGGISPLMLGAEGVEGGIGWTWPALLGLAASGGALAYAVSNDSDGGSSGDHGSSNIPQAPEVIGGVTDGAGQMIADGGATNDRQPTFSGGGLTPGHIVTIYDNGDPIGEVVVDGDGNWSFTPDAPLSEGEHDITTTVTDPDSGNTSEPSPGYDVIIDTTVPDAISDLPRIVDDSGTEIPAGSATNDSQPTFDGGGLNPGDTVIIKDNGEPIGEVVVDENGNWSFTPDQPLAEGDHAITVEVEDPAGNTSEPSAPIDVIIDTTVPDTISDLPRVIDDTGAEVPAGGSTNDSQPTFSGGDQTPGDTVIIKDNGEPIGEAVVDENGNWSFTPEAPLAEGDHAITVEVEDPAGNTSEPSAPIDVVIDTTAPVAPTVPVVTDDAGTEIPAGGATNDSQPTLDGGGLTPGDTVIISDNGEPIGEVVVDENGNWSFTPETPLAEGDHAISVVVEDPTGNTSEPSAPIDVVVDTTVPDAISDLPRMVDESGTEIPAGGATNDSQPTFDGGGLTPGDTVIIKDNGEPIGEAVVDENGNWSFTPETPLAEGDHSMTVEVEDPAGNTSEPSAPIDVVIDTTAPVAPSVPVVTDDAGTEIPAGGATNDSQPTLDGGGLTPGDTVIISDNGEPIGEVVVDENGNWSFTPETPLAEGEHAITVVVEDPTGNTSEPSAPIDVVVDTTVPDAISDLPRMVDESGTEIPAGGATDDSQPTLDGGGLTPGDTVIIKDNGEPIGEAVVDENGNWSFTPETPLAEGDHAMTVEVKDPAGNTSEPSAPIDVIIDTTAPVAPAVPVVTDDAGTEIPAGGATNDSQPTLDGGGLTPGDTVIISDNGEPIGEVVVDENGNWSFTPETPLAEGDHAITVEVVDPAGNTSEPSAPIDVTIDTTVPTAPLAPVVIDDSGITIPAGGATDDSQPTFSGGGQAPGDTVTIYDNGEVIGEVMVDGEGNWSFTPDAPLSDGEHVITTDVTDPAGNTSEPSIAIDVVIDATAPTPPLAPVATDDAGTEIPTGGATNDSQPTFSGGGQASGDTVTIYDNGEVIGEVVVDAGGNWSFTPESPLAEGDHSITTDVTDPNGNTSEPSAPIDVTIDTTVPTAPLAPVVIDDSGITIPAGGATDDSQPTFSGGGQAPGDTVTIYDNGEVIGEVVVDGEGNWSYTPDAPLSDGPHTITTDVTDPAGNTSEPSIAINVVIDTSVSSAVVSIDGISDDTGVPGDFITNDSTLTIYGSLSAAVAADETVQISVDGGSTWRDLVVDGTSWSYVDSRVLADGTHSYDVRVVDAAGNVGSTDSQMVSVDTQPPLASVTIDAISDDTGISDTDFLTADDTLTLHGSLSQTLASGEKVQVSIDGGATWADAVVDGTTWSFVDERVLTSGDHVYEARVVDGFGNAGAVVTQTVTVNITYPTIVPVVTSISDDTGVAGDYITSDTSLTIIGKVDGSGTFDPTRNMVQISTDGGLTWQDTIKEEELSPGWAWSFTDTRELTDGDHEYQVRVVNEYGRYNPEDVVSKVVTIDTAASAAVVTIDSISDDTGRSSTDFLTNDTSLTLFGSLSEALAADETLQVSTDGGSTWLDATVDGTNWSFVDGRVLTNGNHNYQTRVVDVAGNIAEGASRTVSVDTQAPGSSISITGISDDTGIAGDYITSDTTLTIRGSMATSTYPNVWVEVSTDGGVTWNVADKGTFDWSYADDRVLEVGEHEYIVRLTDPAGNYKEARKTVTVVEPGTEPQALLMSEPLAAGGTESNVVGTELDDSLVSNSSDETFQIGNGGNDTLIYKVLDASSQDGTAGNGSDTIDGFTLGKVGTVTDADHINISELLSTAGYTGTGEASYINGEATLEAGAGDIEDYLQVVTNGSNTEVRVDMDGRGATHDSTTLVTLSGVQTDLATLLANHQLTVV